MNVKQKAKLNMYRATEKHCEDNPSIIAANVAFQNAFNKFKENIAAISGTAQQKGVVLKGISADKADAKQTLCRLTADIANFIYAYASANSNNTLKESVNFSFSTLLKTRDEQLTPRCQNIHDLGDENLDALTDYGITKELLADLQTAVNDYSAESPKPRTAASRRKTLNANLSELFAETDTLLKDRMDRLVGSFRAKEPDFVRTYENNRVIVDPSGTTTQLKGIVSGKTDGKPLKGATVTINALARTEKTDAAGEYSFKPIPNGKHALRFAAAGFEDFETDAVEVKLGEIKHLDVQLEIA